LRGLPFVFCFGRFKGASNDRFKTGPRCFVGFDGREVSFLSFFRTIALFLAGTTGSGLPVSEEVFFLLDGFFRARLFVDFTVLVLFAISEQVNRR
jgi:hypothetical protein